MATEVQTFFNNLEAQKTILSTFIDLYKTLTSHFTSLDQSITSKSKILDSKIQTLDSNFHKTLESLQLREDSIPDRLFSLSSLVESQRQSAIDDLQKPLPNENTPFSEALRSFCRKMDAYGMLKLIVTRRKESNGLKDEIMDAVNESVVDSPRFVIDVVREYLDQKMAGKSGITDKRWVCGVLIGSMFPPDELVKGRVGPVFSRAATERAEAVVREWREKVEKVGDNGGGEGFGRMGPAEALMLLQIVLGFGLKDKFEEEFFKKLVLEFASRRDMSKLAVTIFGEKVGDVIDELVKRGKKVEAVYFASDSGLTKRFQPVSLLKSYLQNTEKNVADILEKGNRSSMATDEANNLEIDSIKSIIKCVEDHNLASEFPIESLRKKLTSLEKARADKKKASTAVGSKPPNKRGPASRGRPQASGPPPPHRPAKTPRFSSPYPQFGERIPLSPAQQSPLSRYSGPYSYPS